jgi:N-acetylmuramic acid 6-phosphate (MurNAc-6-P) etherase
MVDVMTGSEKLKDRARRIVAAVTGADPEEAGDLLIRAKWNVKAAIVMKKANLTYAQALRRLKTADDSIRDAIGEDLEPRLKKILADSAAAKAARDTKDTKET